MTNDDAALLAGTKIVVTRSARQVSGLADRLRSHGADVVSVTTIAFEPPNDGGEALRSALDQIDDYQLVAVASPNGARALLGALGEADPGALPCIACVGPGTAAVLEAAGIVVQIVPDRAIAEGLVDAVGAPDNVGDKLLLVQAEVGRPALEQGFTAAEWSVERVVGYRTVDGEVTPEQVEAASDADVICFMSSSSVERYVRLAGRNAVPGTVVSVGPITTSTARELGLSVDVEAHEHTLDGLVDAIVGWAGRS